MPQPSPPLPPGGAPEEIDLDGLFARYEGMLIDSYGVLTYNSGPLPGAAALIERLRAEGRPHFVVTNDASRLPETIAAGYRRAGIALRAEQVVSSGGQLGPYFAEHGLGGARCLVLGPGDSEEAVRRAGGVLLDVSEARPETLDVVVIGDESGYAFVDAVDATISLLIAAFSRGRSVRLVCPNPDLVYPKAPGDFGIASASVAGLIERAVRSQVPERAEEIVFASLGKPAPPLYEEAIRRAGTRDVVMLGDQPSTDIRGANAVGIDSVLLGTGLGRIDAVGGADSRDRPTWVMPSLVTRR
jgi:HAD superfamily hydrolase (TIGR01450 family)